MINPIHALEPLILPKHIYQAIIEHAREGKPEEVCGLLRGRENEVIDIHRAQNVAPHRIMDYEVDPLALLKQFDWEDEGDELIAIYHSHPQDPAYPSASDAINAHYPDAVYIICSLQDDDQPVLRGFHMREAEGSFDLEVARRELSFYETRPGRWATYIAEDEPTPPSLAGLTRKPGQALYIVYEHEEDGQAFARAVTVEERPLETKT
ncbi:MAG: M67 family metallopeptidase [Chloroflexi bacterium]|nr:M67 family metallopeptidase [Chloroflexota bacterium]